MSNYPHLEIFNKLWQKKLSEHNYREINLEEIGEKKDLEELKEWLDSKEYNDLKKKSPIPFIKEDMLEKFTYPSDPKVLQDYKTSHTVEYDEGWNLEKDEVNLPKSTESSGNVNKILWDKLKKFYGEGSEGINREELIHSYFLPQKEVVIYLKFFIKVIEEIENGDKPINSFSIISLKINHLLITINNIYFKTLFDDPYINERIYFKYKLYEKLKIFSVWRFSDYSNENFETEEKLIQGFEDKNFKNISKDKFLKRRKAFRNRAMKRMDRIRNEIKKLSNLHDTSHYAYSNKEIEEICDTLCGSVNNLLDSFTSRNNDFNPVVRKHIDVTPQLDNPKGSDLEVELKSYNKGRTNWDNELKNLRESMEKKFTELELKISSSKEEKND